MRELWFLFESWFSLYNPYNAVRDFNVAGRRCRNLAGRTRARAWAVDVTVKHIMIADALIHTKSGANKNLVTFMMYTTERDLLGCAYSNCYNEKW